jgi:hypothetical protein
MVALLVRVFSRNNTLLRWLFRITARRLPLIEDPGTALRIEGF